MCSQQERCLDMPSPKSSARVQSESVEVGGFLIRPIKKTSALLSANSFPQFWWFKESETREGRKDLRRKSAAFDILRGGSLEEIQGNEMERTSLHTRTLN